MMSKYFILLAFLFATVLVLSSTAETIRSDDSIKAVDVGKLAENKVDANVVPNYCRWGCCGHGGYGGGCRCCSQPHDTQAQAMPEKQIEGEERIHIDAGQGGGSSGGSQGGGKGSGGGQGGGGKGGSGSGGSQGGGKGGSGGNGGGKGGGKGGNQGGGSKGGGKGGGGGGSMHVGVEDLGGYGGGGRGGGGYGGGGGRGGGRGGYGGGGGGGGY